MNRLSLFLLVSALLIASTLALPDIVYQDAASGRCYQYINTTVSSWEAAAAAALAATSGPNTLNVPGYLVTITTAAENSFIFTNVLGNISNIVYTAGFTNAVQEYVWLAGPENGQVVVNATGCVQTFCDFIAGFPNSFAVNNTIQLSLAQWITGPNTDVAGYLIEFGTPAAPCVPSVSPTASVTPTITPSRTPAPSSIRPTTTTGVLSVSPSNFRPTITITSTISTTGSRTTGSRTTGKRTTGRRRTTTGKVSAASSMTFSALSVFVAGVAMLFLRR
jgi:hypothetical protein